MNSAAHVAEDKELDVKTSVRGLDLRLSSTRNLLTAHLFKDTTSVAFRMGDLTRSRVSLPKNNREALLWVDGAAFNVLSKDAQRIAATFGIRLEDLREESA